MDKVKAKLRAAKQFLKTDWNFVRATRLVKRGFRRAPYGAGVYLSNKVPIAQWVTIYNVRWLPYDMLAGVTTGLIMTLQAVNFAIPTPGGISAQQILVACWLPGFIYAVTGTSKRMRPSHPLFTYSQDFPSADNQVFHSIDISVGPTAASIVFSLQIVGAVSTAAKVPGFVVLPALTLAVSGWFLIFGLLGLGFVFDLIPLFFCTAFVTALAIIATTLQALPLFGILGVPNTFMTAMPGLLGSLGDTSLKTVAISVSALIFLGVLSFLKGKWGKERTARGKFARAGAATGVIAVIFISALVSGLFLRNVPLQQQIAPFVPAEAEAATTTAAGGAAAVAPQAQATLNNITGAGVAMISPTLQGTPARRAPMRRQEAAATVEAAKPKLPFWAAFPEFTTPLPEAETPTIKLALSLFFPSFVLFIAVNLEHIVVARHYAHENGYTISKSQEMFSLGLINLANSFFGGVPVGGGDITRAAILGFGGAKSPLNQAFTAGTVIATMNIASGTLRVLPQAALAAIVMITVIDQQPPQTLINTIFTLSFADFIAFFLGMNIGIVAPQGVNTIAAIGVGLAFMILYTLFRIMFKRPKVVDNADLERYYAPGGLEDNLDVDGIPPSTLVVRLEGDLMFVNAERTRRRIVDSAYLHNSGRAVSSSDEPERAWNLAIDRYVNSIRRRRETQAAREGAGAGAAKKGGPVFRPRLRMVVLDMAGTAFMDSSGLTSLQLLKKQLRDWAGESVEFRFVGLNKHVTRRFRRAGWDVVDPFAPRVELKGGDAADDEMEDGEDLRDFVFDTLPQALRYMSQDAVMNGTFSQIVGAEKGFGM